LTDNYSYEHQSTAYVPKGDIHKAYTTFCEVHAIEPFPLASFGKVVNMVFPGVKPRRLGGRDNQRYCYHGIVEKHGVRKSLPKTKPDEENTIPDQYRLEKLPTPDVAGAEEFCTRYYEHLHQIWVAVQHLKVHTAEVHLRKFWSSLEDAEVQNTLVLPVMVEWICDMDALLYEVRF
jgi:hypothetical protein